MEIPCTNTCKDPFTRLQYYHWIVLAQSNQYVYFMVC